MHYSVQRPIYYIYTGVLNFFSENWVISHHTYWLIDRQQFPWHVYTAYIAVRDVSYSKVSGWFILLIHKHFFTSCFLRKRRRQTVRDTREEMRDVSKDEEKELWPNRLSLCICEFPGQRAHWHLMVWFSICNFSFSCRIEWWRQLSHTLR